MAWGMGQDGMYQGARYDKIRISLVSNHLRLCCMQGSTSAMTCCNGLHASIADLDILCPGTDDSTDTS